MKSDEKCGILTKILVYALVLSINLLYMPLANLALVYAAKDSPRVFLLGYAASDDTPDDLKEDLESHFAKQFGDESEIELISMDQAEKKAVKKERGPVTEGTKGSEKNYRRALKYLKRAKEAMDDEEMADVLKYGKKAINKFKKVPDLIKDYDKVKQAYLYYAAGLEEADQDGSKPMKTVLAFDPDFRPKGDFEDYLEDVHGKVSGSGEGRLYITTDPEDATVIVNVREETAPLKLKKLYSGDYYIRVSAKGYEPYSKMLTVKSGKKKLEIVLAGGEDEAEEEGPDLAALHGKLSKKLNRQDFDDNFYAGIQEFGEALKADFVVFGVFKSSEDASKFYPLVYDVNKSKLGKVKSREFDHEELDSSDMLIGKAYRSTKKAIVKRFPKKILASGFELAAPVAAVAEAPVDDYETEPEPEPVYEDEPVAEAVDLSANAAFLLSADDAAKAQEDSESEESIARVEKVPVYKKWWFWTILGVVVVGGGVTAGVLLQPEDQNKSSRLLLPSE